MKKISLIILACLLGNLPLNAATYYWSVDGNGNWDTGISLSWSPNSNGLLPQVLSSLITDDLYFSASNVTTTGTITVAGTQLANSLTINQAGWTFNGGTIDLTTSTSGTLFIGANATINSALKTKGILFTAANQTLTLTGGSPILTNNAQPITGASTNIAKTSSLILASGSYSNGGAQVNLNIGDIATGSGGVVIKQGASFTTNVSYQVGSSGNGLLRLEGGLITQNGGNIVVGRTGGNTGRLIVESGTLNHMGNLDLLVGFASANGIMDMNGGVVNVTGPVAINIQSSGAASYGVVNVNNGTITTSGVVFGKGIGFTASNSGTGTLNLKGGNLYIGATGIANNGTGTSKYFVNLSGGTIGATAAWSSSLDMNLSNIDGGVILKASDAADVAKNITLSGVLSGNGGFTKAGSGTLFLQGINTYIGQTIVSAGTLNLDGGTITISLAALAGQTAILGGGSLILNGTLNISDYASLGNGTWQIVSGDLINVSTYGANFGLTGFTETSVGSGIWKNSNGLVTFTESTGILQAIPEPSTYVLLGFGFVTLWALRGLSRRKA